VTLRVGPFQEYTIKAIEQSGVLKDLPYKIDWSVQTAAGPAMEALNADAVDVAWGLSSTAPEKAQGDAATAWTADSIRFKTVALLVPVDAEKLPRSIVVAGKGVDVKDLAALKGHSVGFNTGGNNHAAFLLALKKGGLTKDDVEGVDLPYKDRPQALRSGDLDVDVNSYEVLATAISEGGKIIATGADIGYPSWTAVVTRTAVLEDQAKSRALEDFVRRISAFQQWQIGHVDELGQLISSFLGISKEDGLLRAKLSLVKATPPDAAAVASEQKVLKDLHGAGFTKNDVDISILFDNRYEAAIKAGAAGTS
jgi:sulfonate transport system substrate-binding protein